MKLIVEIPEGMLDELRTCKFPLQDAYRLCAVIENGIPLPKGHGALKDIDAIISEHAMTKYDWSDCVDIEDLKNAPTIIEADKEGAE